MRTGYCARWKLRIIGLGSFGKVSALQLLFLFQRVNELYLCRYLALGGLDSLVSVWDLEELYCVKTFVVTTYVAPPWLISALLPSLTEDCPYVV
jgi:hypothetical protein